MRPSNAALARRWFEEVWNERRTEIIDELVTAESVCFSEAGELRGKEAFMQLVHGPFVTAFPDLRVEVQEVADAGDVAVVRWTAAATHTGICLACRRPAGGLASAGSPGSAIATAKWSKGSTAGTRPACSKPCKAARRRRR